MEDWQRLLDFLRQSSYALSFASGLTPEPLPAEASAIFASEWTYTLSIDIGEILINCHFFGATEIEFDIYPPEIGSPERLKLLFGFMRAVGRLLAKPVILTPENTPEAVIFRYVPDRDTIIHRPFGGYESHIR